MTTTRSVIISVIAIASILLTPAAAMACRITNATPWSIANQPAGPGVTIYVWFSCGSGCGSYYEIEPGEYVNTAHGKGGTVQACTYGYPKSPESTKDPLLPHDAEPAIDDYWYREAGEPTKIGGSSEARVKTPGDSGRVDTPRVYGQFQTVIYDSDNNVTQVIDHGSRMFKSDTSSTDCWDGTA
jgi:hypothetical protein